MFLVLLLGLFLALIIWREYYKRNWDKNVKVTLHFSSESIYEGEHTKLIEVIENRKKMPLPLLEVGFHTKKDLNFQNADNTYISDNTYKRDIFAVLGRQKITRQIDVRGKKRGYYEIGEVDLTTFSVLHETKYGKSLNSNANLYVYPARVKVDDILVICEKLLGNIQCAKHLFEDPFAFRSIREYTIDDPMKTINWKASARGGKLMVNTFDSALSQKAFIFLDLEDSSILKHDHLIEYNISLVATLAYKLLLRNMELGIASNAGINVEAATGKKQMASIEKMLALYEEPKNQKMTEMSDLLKEHLKQEKNDKNVIYIFVSKNISEETTEGILNFVGYEIQGIWICPVTMGDQKEIETAEERKKSLRCPNLKFMIKEVAK